MSISLSNLQYVSFTSPNITTINSSTLEINGSITIASSLTVSGNINRNGNTLCAMNISESDSGHTVIVEPMSCLAYHASAPGVNTSVASIDIGGYFAADAHTLYILGALQYDFWRTYVNLVAGTYTFRIDYGKSNDRGIATLKLNDIDKGTVDGYRASSLNSLDTINSITVQETGVYKLELQLNTKNASSSGYYFVWRRASLIRTA